MLSNVALLLRASTEKRIFAIIQFEKKMDNPLSLIFTHTNYFFCTPRVNAVVVSDKTLKGTASRPNILLIYRVFLILVRVFIILK